MAGTADGETDLLASSLLARRQNGVLESINTIFVARTQWRSHIGVGEIDEGEACSSRCLCKQVTVMQQLSISQEARGKQKLDGAFNYYFVSNLGTGKSSRCAIVANVRKDSKIRRTRAFIYLVLG